MIKATTNSTPRGVVEELALLVSRFRRRLIVVVVVGFDTITSDAGVFNGLAVDKTCVSLLESSWSLAVVGGASISSGRGKKKGGHSENQ